MSHIYPAQPDLSQVNDNILSTPTEGQRWFNVTNKHLYVYDGVEWVPLMNRSDYAANWGQIESGQKLPKPVGEDGYVFDYQECIWNTSPAVLGKFDNFVCYADADGTVTAKYRPAGSAYFIGGVANYIIIGIRGNTNRGLIVAPPVPSPTPSPTPTAGSTMTPTPTVSVTVSVTPTVSPSTIPDSPTPTPTPSLSVGASPTPTPTRSPTPSFTPSRTPSVTPTRTPAASIAPSTTPSPTPSVTPSTSALVPMSIVVTDDEGSTDASQLYSYCNTALYDAANRDGGYAGCAATTTTLCAAGACSPEPGDAGLGPVMRVTITGGVAPYTVRLQNFTVDTSRNLVNPNFELGDTGWIKSPGWSIAVNGDAYEGSRCAVFTGSGTGITILNSATPAITPGTSVTASMRSVIDDGEGDYQNTVIVWYNSSMVEIGRANGNHTGGNENWGMSTVTAVAPAGAAFVRMGTAARKTHGYPNLADTASWSLGATGTPECFFVGGANVPSVPYAGIVKTYTVPSSGSSTPIISLNGICGTATFNMRGTFDIYVTDSASNTRTITKTWYIERYTSGGGGGGGGGGCVTTDSLIYGHVGTADTVMIGDTMTVIDPVSHELGTGLVSYATAKKQPCVEIETTSGIVLRCSKSAPLALADGSQILAKFALNNSIQVMNNGVVGVEEVIRVDELGIQPVMHITCENNFFMAGTTEGKYILHHNLKEIGDAEFPV